MPWTETAAFLAGEAAAHARKSRQDNPYHPGSSPEVSAESAVTQAHADWDEGFCEAEQAIEDLRRILKIAA